MNSINRRISHPDFIRRAFTVPSMLLLLIFGMGFTSKRPDLQMNAWTEPIELSNAFGGWFPDVIADRYGRVHVVWASSIAGAENEIYDVVMYRWLDPADGWSEPFDIASLLEVDGRGYATRPLLALDEEGVFHLTYRNEQGVHYKQSKTSVNVSAKDWYGEQTMVSYGYFSEVVADRAGNLHILYTINIPTEACSICFHLFHRVSANNGFSWSDPVDISIIPTGAAKPAVIVDPENRLHVVWESGEGGDLGQLFSSSSIYYTQYDPAGETWTKPAQLSTDNEDSKNPTITIDRFGRLLAVYLSIPENLIIFRQSINRGKDWTDPVEIEGVQGAYLTALDRMDAAVDSGGIVHLVLVGRADEPIEGEEKQDVRTIYHLSWDGLEWSPAEVVTHYQGDVPEWPSVTVSEGNILHLVWFVRDAENIWQSDSGNYSIWYASAQVQAPHQTPMPLDAVVATPISSLSESGDSTESESVPAGSRALDPALLKQPVDIGLVQEADYILLIGKSLIPAFLLTLAIIIYRAIRPS